MKSRKGFAKISINGEKFLFNWANNPDGPMLIMYASDSEKIEIPYTIWEKYPNSKKYDHKTWHGKHKKGAEWGVWGKREAREMYFKYLQYSYDLYGATEF
jgi:hypothetical protein